MLPYLLREQEDEIVFKELPAVNFTNPFIWIPAVLIVAVALSLVMSYWLERNDEEIDEAREERGKRRE